MSDQADMANDLAASTAGELDRLRRVVRAIQRGAEQNARSGTLDYDERTRWRRFAAQLAEALR